MSQEKRKLQKFYTKKHPIQILISMDDDRHNEVHLIKLKLNNKNVTRLNIVCPFLEKFSPTIEMKNKSILFIPLINKIMISKDFISNSKSQQIPVNIQPLLQYPFDKHNIKIQTYEDQNRTAKGDIINIHLQFSLFLTQKEKKNYVSIFFRHANLKKDLKLFGKMSPHIVIITQETKLKTRQIKDGHLNPRFQEEVNVPFKSVFDKIVIQLKQGEQRIGYNDIFIFELFGKNDERQLELKKEHKMVGTLVFSVEEFQPQDF